MSELTDEQIKEALIAAGHVPQWPSGDIHPAAYAGARAVIAADRALRANPPGDAAMPVIGYLRATSDGQPVWSEDCVCEDPIYPSDPEGSDEENISMPMVRQADALAALAAKESSLAAEIDLNRRLLRQLGPCWDALRERGILNAGQSIADAIRKLPPVDALAERDAELAALKAGLAAIRDCFPAPAAGSAREDAWSEAMSAPECIAAYVVACVADKDAEIAAVRQNDPLIASLAEAVAFLRQCQAEPAVARDVGALQDATTWVRKATFALVDAQAVQLKEPGK